MTGRSKSLLFYLCLVLLLLTQLVAAQEEEEDNSNYYGTSSAHNGIRDATPRFLGNKGFHPTESDWDGAAYALSVGSTMFYGIALALLALIVALLWCMWRVCKCAFYLCKCCLCCCIKAKERVPTGSEDDAKRNLFIMLGCLMLMLCTWSTVCLVYNSEISNAIFDNRGLFAVADNTLDGGYAVVLAIAKDLLTIITEIDDRIDDIIATVAATPDLFEGGPASIQYAVDNASAAVRDADPFTVNVAVGVTTATYPCAICTDVADDLDLVGGQAIADVQETIDQLNLTIIETTEYLIDQKEVIVQGLNDTIELILGDVEEYYHSAKDALADAEQYAEEYESYRENGVACLYIFPFIGVIIMFLAMYLKSSKLLQSNILPFWISWLFVSILMAVHFPIAIVIGDSCVWIKDNERSYGGQPGKIRDVCLDGQPVDTIYNFTEFVAFRDAINVNLFTQDEIDALFEFESYHALRDQISAYSASDWVTTGSLDFNSIDSNMDAFNIEHGPEIYVTRDNATSTEAYNIVIGDADETIRIEYDNFAVPLQLEEQIDAMIADVNASFDEFDAFMDTLKQNVTDLANTVNELNDNLDPIFKAVDAIIQDFDCSFIGEAYVDLKGILCDRIGGSVTYLCLFSFLLVVCAIPTTFLFCITASAITDQNKADKFFAKHNQELSAEGENDLTEMPDLPGEDGPRIHEADTTFNTHGDPLDSSFVVMSPK